MLWRDVRATAGSTVTKYVTFIKSNQETEAFGQNLVLLSNGDQCAPSLFLKSTLSLHTPVHKHSSSLT